VLTGRSGLVSPQWVAEHLDDHGLVLVEVDEEAATHHWSHIPGATFIDWQDCRKGLLGPAPAAIAAFERLMSLRGIRPDDDVVLYGDGQNRYAAAVLWLMRLHGHRSLRLMDGGRAAWTALGLPMTEQESKRAPSAYVAGPGDPAVRATRDDLLSQLMAPTPEAVVVDCRTPQEFSGGSGGPAEEFGDLCAERGHVPGAINLPYSDLLAPDGTLLEVEQLEQALSARGLHVRQSITTYCHSADRSSLVWFALSEVLGYPSVRVYDGGWLEYGHLMGVPVTRPQDGD
jgi:thiosulfate/3-mercaptopyruvate sulfurtransferase